MKGAGAGSGRTAGAGLSLLLRTHKGATIAFVVVLIVVLFAALTTRVLFVKKGSIEKRVELLTSNFVDVIDEQISSSIGKIDLVVLALADELQEQLASRQQIDVKSVTAIMAKYVSRIPELNGLRVTDAAGTVIVATGLPDNARVSFADRDFFQAHQASLSREIIVSKPMLGRVSDGWITVLSRKYLNPDGSFGGVIAAPIRIAHLTKLLSVLDLGPGGIAVIRDRDLALVTRYPPIAGPAGVTGSDRGRHRAHDLVPPACAHAVRRARRDLVRLLSDGLARRRQKRHCARRGVRRRAVTLRFAAVVDVAAAGARRRACHQRSRQRRRRYHGR
jgi:hypothetical protein